MGGTYEPVTVDRDGQDGRVARVTLIGPGKGNSIVLTGSGRHFSYGSTSRRWGHAGVGHGRRPNSQAALGLSRAPQDHARCARCSSRSSPTSDRSRGCRSSSTTGTLRELALTGRDIDAARAARIGLVNDVFDEQRTAQVAASRR